MKSLWFGSYSEFAKPFRDNETMSMQARAFWNQLDQIAIILFIAALVIGTLFAAHYYTLYNRKPGRHYQPKHWWMFLLIAFVFVLVATFGAELLVAKPRLDGAVMLELRVAFGNAVFALLLYLLISFAWCNLNLLPTNAYRYLKIKK